MKHPRTWTYDKITTVMNTYLEEAFQGYASLLTFCPLILATIRGPCLDQWLPWCSHNDFLFLFPSYIYYLELFCKGGLSLLCHLFIYSSMGILQVRISCYHLFHWSNCSNCPFGSPFELAPVFFGHIPIFLFVRFTLLLSAPGSPCVSLTPVLASAISPQSSGSFYLETKIWIVDGLVATLTISRPSQWPELGNICSILIHVYIHLSTPASVSFRPSIQLSAIYLKISISSY